MDKNNHITVFYDGACPKCVNDRKDYEKMAGDTGHDVFWMDITGRNKELLELGIDPDKALTELHVRDQHGHILSEIDAYILLMQRVPRLKALAWLISLPLIRSISAFFYHKMVNRRLKAERRLENHSNH